MGFCVSEVSARIPQVNALAREDAALEYEDLSAGVEREKRLKGRLSAEKEGKREHERRCCSSCDGPVKSSVHKVKEIA